MIGGRRDDRHSGIFYRSAGYRCDDGENDWALGMNAARFDIVTRHSLRSILLLFLFRSYLTLD